MADADSFSIERSDLNGFLFADVGVEPNGMTLSVLSAFARLGMDPWDEASRLARQPRSAATEGLARMIASLPPGLWPLPDSTAIAARLVALLPARGVSGATAGLARTATPQSLGKSVIGRLSLRAATGGKRDQSQRPAPSILVLVLLAGLLAGLTLYLGLQRQSKTLEVHPPAATAQQVPDQTPGAINKGI